MGGLTTRRQPKRVRTQMSAAMPPREAGLRSVLMRLSARRRLAYQARLHVVRVATKAT